MKNSKKKVNYREVAERLLNENVEDFGNYQELQEQLMEAIEKAEKYDELMKELKVRRLASRTAMIIGNEVNVFKVLEYKLYRSLCNKKTWITNQKN